MAETERDRLIVRLLAETGQSPSPVAADRTRSVMRVTSEIVLWAFVFPGLIYSLWRRAIPRSECPNCHRTDSLISVQSPMGQQLLTRSQSSSPTGAASEVSVGSTKNGLTPELLVSLWSRLFGIEPPSGAGQEEYMQLASTALVAVAIDLRRSGAITLSQTTEPGHGHTTKTMTTVGFGDLSGDLSGVAAVLLSNDRARTGMEAERFFEGLPLGKRHPVGLMSLIWEQGVERGAYTKHASGLKGRNVLYAPNAEAKANAEAAAQELAREYKAAVENEPALVTGLRRAAQLAIPVPREIESDDD